MCVGFGEAARLAVERRERDHDHVEQACRSWRSTRSATAGSSTAASTQRYRGNLNLRREGLDAARLLADLRNIAFSLGSACASGSGRPSHVLRALGLSDREARSSIRLGFGRYTGEEELVVGLPPHRRRRAAQQAARRMTLVRFLKADGTLDREVERRAGTVLLDVAQANGQPLEGAARARWPARPAT